MNYVFVLAPRTLQSPPLLHEIDSQLDSWVFDELDRKSTITIRICPIAERELQALHLPTLRRLMRLRHRIHPDMELVFERLQPGNQGQNILAQRGVKD